MALMLRPESSGEAFNLGSQEEVTIEGLARQIIELAKSASQLQYIPYDKAYEEGFEDMLRRVPDITKANKAVGFAPTVPLQDILHSVIDYYRNEPRLSPERVHP